MNAWLIVAMVVGSLLILPLIFAFYCSMLVLVAKDFETLDEAQQQQDANRWAKHTARKVMREEKWWL